MRRRAFLCGSVALLAAPRAGGAQQVTKVPTLGYVDSDPTGRRWQDGFERGLRDHGYVLGRSIAVEVRNYSTRDELQRALKEFVRGKVDLIFVGPPVAAVAARQATKDIPIVCGSCGDPIENGLAASLARPGGNVTGLASLSAELIGKRLELVKELLPGVSRVAVLLFPDNPGTRSTLRQLATSGPLLGLEIKRIEIRGAADFANAFSSAASDRVGAVVLQDDPLLRTVAPQIGELGLKHRLALSAGVFELAEAGALMAYGPDRVDLYRRAVGFIDKILKGAKPGELPFEQATKFGLVVNLKTAKTLGLTIPPSLLARADQVIE